MYNLDMRRTVLFLLAAALTASAPPPTPAAGAVPVKVTGGPGRWALLRGGKPYFVHGAGGTVALDELAGHGADSMRTWGADQLPASLDQAESRGMTLLVGLWLGHKADVDYANPAQVAAQQAAALATVRQYKDRPGVLAWGLGNEMEADGNDTPEMWRSVEALAAAVKALDPNHPTVTVVADVTPGKLDNIRRYAPDIDILGVNSYGGAPSVAQRLADGGWTKPYLLTEFGPSGPWETEKTSWGAPVELTSTQKARVYARAYAKAVVDAPGRCLGSYAFAWGFKYEGTATWFGMLMPDTLETLGAVDAISQLWTGRRPDNLAPEVQPLDFPAARNAVSAGSAQKACVKASDPDDDLLSFVWRLTKDENGAPDLLASAPDRTATCVSFSAPADAGAYRLYAEVRDGRGHGATANAPFLVK